jgi:hypothetical protein
MSTYILTKEYFTHMPGPFPPGTEVILDKDSYKVVGVNYYFAKEFVEHSPEWFYKKQEHKIDLLGVHESVYKKINIGAGLGRPETAIIPEHIWVELRVKELQDAFEKTHFTHCEAWIEEWNRHVNWLMNRKKEENVSNQEKG